MIAGETLEHRTRTGPADLRAGLAVVAEVARVVAWVHARGFAHRNLTAANVLVARDGGPWLIGFGRVIALAEAGWLPPGVQGTPPTEDKRGLHELVAWLFELAGRPAATGVLYWLRRLCGSQRTAHEHRPDRPPLSGDCQEPRHRGCRTSGAKRHRVALCECEGGHARRPDVVELRGLRREALPGQATGPSPERDQSRPGETQVPDLGEVEDGRGHYRQDQRVLRRGRSPLPAGVECVHIPGRARR